MRRNLASVSGASAAILIVALVPSLSPVQTADAFSPLEIFQPQQSGPQAQQSDPRSERSDQGLEVSAYADDTDRARVYRQRRFSRHAHHHRRRERQEEEASAPAVTPSLEPEAKPLWEVATAPTATLPNPSAVSTFQIVLITQDGGDPFERCMTAYYWSRLNHAFQADQIFDPARRYAVDATSPEVTSHLAESWIGKSIGR
jgi:hypothetical protein